MKKNLTAADWLARINRAKKFRNQVRDKQGWARFLEQYEGDYKVGGQAVKSPPINLVYGYVDTAISKLYFRDPHMSVNPRGAQYAGGAKILEASLEFLFREMGLKGEHIKVLMDTFLVGHGWLKFGYNGTTAETDSQAPAEKSEYIKDEEIFISFVPWEDILFDVTLCKDPPNDCRWIAHRIIKPVQEVKDSYEHTAKITSNVSTQDAKGDKIDDTLKDADLDLFEFWEIFDKDSGNILVVAEGTTEFLRQTPNKYAMKGLPFAMMAFNRIPGKPYPLSDISIIEPQILERIKLRAAQLNHTKRWSRQMSIEKGAMNKEEMEKFEQAIDGAVTQREKGTQPPTPIQYAAMQEEIFQLDDLIQRDMDAAIGQNDVERGGQARTKTNTLGELKEQQQGVMGRSARRQDLLEDFLEEVATKLIALIKQFQTTPRYVRITGMTEQEIASAFPGLKVDASGIWFTRDDIMGEYDVDVKAGSTLPLNRGNKVRLIETLLQPQVGATIGVVPGSPISFELGKELIRELDMKAAEKIYDQMAQAAQTATPPGMVAGQPGMAQGGPQMPTGASPMGQAERLPSRKSWSRKLESEEWLDIC